MKRTLTTLGVAAAFALGGLAVAGPASAAPMPHTSGNGTHGTVLGSSPLPGDHGLDGTGKPACKHIGWSKRCAPTTAPKCPTKCRPAKTPPPGGWPCKADKSCSTKHHYPVCPPVKPPVTPPSTVTPKPPVIHNPKPAARVRVTPKARVRLVADVKPTPQLAMTGVDGSTYFAGGLGLGSLGLGIALVLLTRRPAKVTHDVRSVL